MKAYIRYDFSPVFYAQIGLDHYALWGGNSPDHGQMPTSFADYLRVITGRSASASGTASDQINVLGDQGGAEQFRFGWKTSGGTLTLQYEKPYSDKSGMTFQNIPDGLYTLHFARKDRHAWISDVLLERMYTMYQSGTIHDKELDEQGRKIIWTPDSGLNFNGGDDYFVNFEYKSGWSYFGRSICIPLLTPNHLLKQNTRAKAWHLGLAGELFREAPYKLMLTWSKNYGTYFKPFVHVPGTEYGSACNTGWQWWQEEVYDKGLRQFSAAFTCCLPLSGGRGKASVDAVCGLYTDIGEYIRFRTDSPTIWLRWESQTSKVMNHMSPTGSRGLDLYVHTDGGWRFVRSGRPELKAAVTEQKVLSDMTSEMREYMLYLSLYDGVSSLSIGTEESHPVLAGALPSPRSGHPVVFYGTSVTQGGCVSRPGMVYTSILSRELDREFINLGFSGNALLDLEIARLMAAVPAPSLYVIACADNATPEQFAERGEAFFRTLREAHPDVPVVFVQALRYAHTYLDRKAAARSQGQRDACRALYERLRKAGEKRIFFTDPGAGKAFSDAEQSVDGSHLTDLGTERFSEEILPVLRKALRVSPSK